ncbi:MAG: sigma-70 family RNA polymerase sigma factor [Phycisphaerae bacterium]
MAATVPPSPEDPDTPLLTRARAGDYAAFELLVGRHEQRVYFLARRIVGQMHDAEEVVQETFLSALEHLSQFRGDSSFRTWLLRIATHSALKVLRKRRRLVSLPESELSGSHEGGPHPEFIAPWREDPADLAQRTEIRQLLDEALQGLEEKYRLVFVLRDLEQLSVEETASTLQISPANVKVRLMRARLMLREKLTKVLGDPTQAARPHPHG